MRLFGLAGALALVSLAPAARAESREAGPIDGIACCADKELVADGLGGVAVMTGRAGIMRSQSRGERWHRAMTGFVGQNGVEPFGDSFCQPPDAPRTLYATAGLGRPWSPFNGLLRSTDFGKTWTRGAAFDVNSFPVCAVDPRTRGTLYVMTGRFNGPPVSILKSADGGDTVRDLSAALPPLDGPDGIAVGADGTVYVSDSGTYSGLYVSKDGGATFAKLPNAPTFPGTPAAHPHRGGLVFVQDGAGSTWRSTDGGASFLPVALPANASLAFDPAHDDSIYAGNSGLFHSSDGGQTFTKLAGPAPAQLDQGIGNLAVDRRSIYVATSFKGMFRSDDRGATFKPIMNGFRGADVQDLGFDAAGRLLVGTIHTHSLFRQTRPGAFDRLDVGVNTVGGVCSTFSSCSDVSAMAASPSDANTLVVGTATTGPLWSNDGGKTFNPASGALLFMSFYSRMIFADAKTVYAVLPRFSEPGLYRSDDSGHSYARIRRGRFGSIAVDPRPAGQGPKTIYLGSYDSSPPQPMGVYKSPDGGATLTALRTGGNWSAIVVDSRHPDTIYIGAEFGLVERSLDGGASWAPASAGLTGHDVLGMGQDSTGALFVWVRAGGVFRSVDGATTWTAIDTGGSLARSGTEAGRASFAVDPLQPGHVYVGNESVLLVTAGDGDRDGDRDSEHDSD
jgi:photosystem II stability/assembly factor-like uncharacterized protein